MTGVILRLSHARGKTAYDLRAGEILFALDAVSPGVDKEGSLLLWPLTTARF
jgi:hypothetical protein